MSAGVKHADRMAAVVSAMMSSPCRARAGATRANGTPQAVCLVQLTSAWHVDQIT